MAKKIDDVAKSYEETEHQSIEAENMPKEIKGQSVEPVSVPLKPKSIPAINTISPDY